MGLAPQRAPGGAVGGGVDQERVPRGEGFARVGHPEGVDGAHRALDVIEVEAPVQKALQIVLIEQRAHDAAAGAGHGHEAVGHRQRLHRAVIGPQVLHAVVHEGLDVVVADHRLFHDALAVDVVAAEGVDDVAALQQAGHCGLGGGVGLLFVVVGLVRNVEPHVVQAHKAVQLRLQCGQEGVEEFGVLATHRRGVPPEALFQPLGRLHHHLGGELRPPLGEQVGHLDLGDAVAAGHLYPAAQLVKAEAPPAILKGHVHQLHGGALAALGGVQRRGEHRREQHVDAVVGGAGHEIVQDAPVLLAEHRHMVVVRKAVGVEPLGLQQGLGRQGRVQHLHPEGKLRQLLALRAQHLQPQVRRAGGKARRVQREPQAAPLGGHRLEGFLPARRAQQVRQQAGPGGEVVLVPDAVAGVVTGHQLHPEKVQGRLRGARAPQRKQRGGLAEVVVFAAVGQLEGPALIFQQPGRAGVGGFRPSVRQHLFQAVGEEKFIARHRKTPIPLSGCKTGEAGHARLPPFRVRFIPQGCSPGRRGPGCGRPPAAH